MADVPSSSTQDRVAALFSLSHDGTYAHAARVLTAAGLPGDGCPSGLTWRQVKKLSDAELRLALPRPVAITEAVPTLADTRAAAEADYQTRQTERAARARTNAILREAGYRWTKVAVQDSPSPLADDWSEMWTLLNPSGNVVTVANALAAIREAAVQ